MISLWSQLVSIRNSFMGFTVELFRLLFLLVSFTLAILLILCFSTTMVMWGLVLYLYTWWTMGSCHNQESLAGKLAIVTGGTSGVGKETAKELARRGAHVIIGARTPRPNAIRAMKEAARNDNIELWELDLMDMVSVTNFAQRVKDKDMKVDLLVNNAGIFYKENTIQVNFHGHFHLTNLLEDNLSDNARIVNVSSCLNVLSNGNVELSSIDYSSYLEVYNTSKLMMIMFTRELERRWGERGITSFSLHPGFVDSNIFMAHPWKKQILNLAKIYAKTPLQGAQTCIYLCTQKGIEEMSGRHFADCKSGWWADVWTHHKADDQIACRKLWEQAEKKMDPTQEIRQHVSLGLVDRFVILPLLVISTSRGSEEVTISLRDNNGQIFNRGALAITSEAQVVDLNNVQEEYESNLKTFTNLLEINDPVHLSSTAVEVYHNRFTAELFTALQKLNSSIDTLMHGKSDEEIAGLKNKKTDNIGKYRQYVNCIATRIWDLSGNDIETCLMDTVEKTEGMANTVTIRNNSENETKGKNEKIPPKSHDEELPEQFKVEQKPPVLKDPPNTPGLEIDQNSTLTPTKIETHVNPSLQNLPIKPTNGMEIRALNRNSSENGKTEKKRKSQKKEKDMELPKQLNKEPKLPALKKDTSTEEGLGIDPNSTLPNLPPKPSPDTEHKDDIQMA